MYYIFEYSSLYTGILATSIRRASFNRWRSSIQLGSKNSNRCEGKTPKIQGTPFIYKKTFVI